MRAWESCCNSLLLYMAIFLFKANILTAQEHVIPVTEAACAQCCLGVTFSQNIEAEQASCQQQGCRGSQLNLNQAQAACVNLFGIETGRVGCEIGRDFRLSGFTQFLNNLSPLFQCTQEGVLTASQPPVGPPILTAAQCDTCCTQLDNGFDAVAPDDFAVASCAVACTNGLFCDLDILNRNRLGCSIGVSFLTEGQVVLRETDRKFTCNQNGLVANFPTNSPTFKADDDDGNENNNNNNNNDSTVLAVSISGVLLLVIVILAFIYRRRQTKGAQVLSNTPAGSFGGSGKNPTDDFLSQQNLPFFESKANDKEHQPALYYSYDGTVSVLTKNSSPPSGNFSNANYFSEDQGRETMSLATVVEKPMPPPKTPKSPMRGQKNFL